MERHGFLHTVAVDQFGVVLVEPVVDHGGDVARVRPKILRQLAGGVVLVAVAFLHDDLLDDLSLKFVHHFWAHRGTIGGRTLLLVFCNIIL